ncbi:hypothetical protein DSO57_1034957 [Entomophthora muscae]|uniref:Uncharacterized protein n=1 Tax=Entomophthora muscae TaxID=34485 RepID=A0ACC2TLR9_9FUNG|nr:hypothetical protein DSO57_1034957 [Entomophthora muscae]
MEGYYTNTTDSVCRWNLNNLSPADSVALAEIKGFGRGMYVLIAALVLSTAICLYTMITHLLNYREQKCQRYMVRMLLLIPLGGLVAVLNYHFYQYEHYLVLARGLYTGVAAVDLGLLLNATIGNDDCSMDEKSPFPFDTLKFAPPAEQQSPLQQLLVNQFSIFQSASSIIGAILQGTKNMCPFDLNINQPLPYLRATSVSSSLISIYSLLKLHKKGSLCFKDRVPKSTVVFFIVLTFVPNIVSLGFELLVHYSKSIPKPI